MAHTHDNSELAALRDRVAGWRVLLVGNRGAEPVAVRLAHTLDIRCTVEDAAGKPRRRRSLVERIDRRSYDAALVAHGFTHHADTEQIAHACRRAGVPFVAVGKGRFSEIVQAMRVVLLPPART